MKIQFNKQFVLKLDKQIDYISHDSPTRARKFKEDLLHKINEIPSNPLRYRKSIYANNQTVRDLIFKGYTIVFRISHNTIDVFGFVKYQKKL
jgi:plasmid stabilization system protein ParE